MLAFSAHPAHSAQADEVRGTEMQAAESAQLRIQCDRVASRECWDVYRHCRRKDGQNVSCCEELKQCLSDVACSGAMLQC